jgi:hypothetical protein
MQNDNPANPSEYIYNKSTIGGVDQSKLEYKESLKEKIYISKPSHMYSWVILFIIVFVMILGGVLYFVYPDLMQSLGISSNSANQVTDTKNKEDVALKQKMEEEKSLRERYLEIKTPLTLDNDETISKIKTLDLNMPPQDMALILSEQTLINIQLEFSKVAEIYLGGKPTNNPSANNIYNNAKHGFSFALPENYQYLSEDEKEGTSFIYFGIPKEGTPTAFLTVKVNANTDYATLEKCNGQNENTCLESGTDWGQNNDVEKIILSGKNAESFYVSEGKDNSYHIVQTVDNPTISLQMVVSEGGLDKDFSQIINTFKFN